MREIKFRAWHKERKLMYWFDVMWGNHYPSGSGYIGMCPFGISRKHLNFTSDNREEIDPNNCELMQYTGLKDKNENEIYEGDIITHMEKPKYAREPVKVYAQVVFDRGIYKITPSLLRWNDLYLHLLSTKIEVVGNIYENTELLKEK